MKKLLFLVPLFTLTACANGSMFDAFGGGTGGGGKIDKAKAKQIYEDNIYGVDTSKSNIVMEYDYYSENNWKDSKEKSWEREKYLFKITEDRHFYFSVENSRDDGYVSKEEFYYGQARGEDVGYYIETEYGKIVRQAAYVGTYDYENASGDGKTPYDLHRAFSLLEIKDTYTSISFSYLEQMAVQGFTDSGTGLDYAVETTYSSKNSKSLEIKTEMKLVSKPDYSLGVNFGAGIITFENSRFTKYYSRTGREDLEEKSFNDITMNFSYPSKLNINLPSDWTRYVVD